MDETSPIRNRIRGRTVPILAIISVLVPALSAVFAGTGRNAQKGSDVPRLLLDIRDEVLGLPRYPGESFARGEFFLGEGDDDTYKTHAVGVLVNEEAEGSRLTIVVSRLEPARDDPRVKYAREPRTIACRIAGDTVEMLRSDYAPPELAKLLPLVLKAVVDKKALLRRFPTEAGEKSS